MAVYKISGIWKDDNVITHYGVHTVSNNGTSRVVKTSKADAIALVDNSANIVYTWVWNYSRATWVNGEQVHVVGNHPNKYLRSNPDNRLTDNLGHLINLDWFIR